MLTRGQFAWLIFCLLIIVLTVGFTLIYRAVTGSQEHLPVLGMACFFGLGGFLGVLIGGGNK